MEGDRRLNLRTPGIPFIAIGVVFLLLGAARRPALLGVGAAFLAVGLGLLARSRGRADR